MRNIDEEVLAQQAVESEVLEAQEWNATHHLGHVAIKKLLSVPEYEN